MEIAPGIYQIKVPIPDNPLEFLLSYLIRGSDGFIMVDTGWPSPEGMEAIERQLGELGIAFGDITTIVVTHIHPDHFGLARPVKDLTGANLIMHRLDKPDLNGWHIGFPEFRERMVAWLSSQGVPEEEIAAMPMPVMPPDFDITKAIAMPDIEVEGGEVIGNGSLSLEIIWTPGHSPGHICLYDRERRILFSGDHVLPIITPNVSLLRSMGEGNPLADYVSSLRKVEDYEVNLVLPAHEHIFYDLQGRLRQIQEHHVARLERVVEAMEGQWKTTYQIAQKVPWDLAPWDELGPWDRCTAVGETLAHLEYLRLEGQVKRKKKSLQELFQPKRRKT